jgi:V8-like Glu-specific endopeptidase
MKNLSVGNLKWITSETSLAFPDLRLLSFLISTKYHPLNITHLLFKLKFHFRNTLTTGASVFMAAVLLAQTGNAGEINIQSKINEGKDTSTQEWPFMVALVHKGTSHKFCGGTLIAKNWVLTAAHCVVVEETNQLRSINAIDIIINDSALNPLDKERIAVEKILSHGGHHQPTPDNNDIALVKLATASNALPVEILSQFSDQDEAGNNGLALGWGSTDFVSDLISSSSKDLQQVTLPIISNDTCQPYYDVSITDNMVCAGFATGNKGDTCRGDSGGPLLIYDTTSGTWRQAGITSFGRDFYCGSLNGAYGVYTRVKNYKSLISEIICSAEELPPTPILEQPFVYDRLVILGWSGPDTETTYQILYRVYGEQTFHTLEMGHETGYLISLPKGSDYEVKVHAQKGNCEGSSDSNIERITVI